MSSFGRFGSLCEKQVVRLENVSFCVFMKNLRRLFVYTGGINKLTTCRCNNTY